MAKTGFIAGAGRGLRASIDMNHAAGHPRPMPRDARVTRAIFSARVFKIGSYPAHRRSGRSCLP
jgi:hypothetical protein